MCTARVAHNPVVLVAVFLVLGAQYAAGQEIQCAGARQKRSRSFTGGVGSNNVSILLQPPASQAVLPPSYCEFWRIDVRQIKGTSCYPTAPTAGLSYLLVELWVGASWNTTGTSPQWDNVNLGVYRMSNMDDKDWDKRSKAGYGYERVLDRPSGEAYHRVVVSTFQVPGAAKINNDTIEQGFELDPWFVSIDNKDTRRSLTGYNLKISCVNPNTLPCPASSPNTQPCTQRGTCTANATSPAPSNYCDCLDYAGFACQTSTGSQNDDTATTAAPLDSMFLGLNEPVASTTRRSSWDRRWLLVLLFIPIAIGAWIITSKCMKARNKRKQVIDMDAVKEQQPTKAMFEPLHHTTPEHKLAV